MLERKPFFEGSTLASALNGCRFIPVFFLTLLYCAFFVQTQAQYNARSAQIEDAILRLDYAGAQTLIEQEADLPLRAHFQHRELFFKTFIGQSPKDLAQFQILSGVVEAAFENSPNGGYKRFYMAQMYLERAIVHIIQNKYAPAVQEMRKSLKNIREQAKLTPGCLPNQGLEGLFLVAFSAVPKQFRWATNLLGLKGNFDAGMARLTAAAQTRQTGAAQFQISLYFISRILQNDFDRAAVYTQQLAAARPDHVLFTYLKAHNAIDRKANDEAVSLMEGLMKRKPNLPYAHLPYYYYQLGRSYFFRQDFDSAIRYFDRFQTVFKGAVFRPDAKYKQGLAYLWKNEPDKARLCFQQTLACAATGFDEDSYARKQAQIWLNQSPNEVQTLLLKARYLYDGGYNDRAAAALKNVENKKDLTIDQQTELFYRKGRIAEARKATQEAIDQYARAGSLPAQAALWMKAYALYYQAQLLEKQHNKEGARAVYLSVLELDNYDYQKGLEQKVKTALQQLK